MSFVKSLNFQTGTVADGDVLDFVSTADISVPAGSEIALKTIKFTPGEPPFASGTLSLTLRQNNTTSTLMSIDLPKFVPSTDQAALDVFLGRLNDAFREQVSEKLLRNRLPLNPFIGSTVTGFEAPQQTINFSSTQYVQFGINDALDQQEPTDPELIQQNVIPLFNDVGGTVQLNFTAAGGATDDGYLFGQTRMTQFGFARMRPGARDQDVTNGAVSLTLTGARQNEPGGNVICSIAHFYYAANNNTYGVRQGRPGVKIIVDGREVLTAPTTNFVYYEIRKFDNKFQIFRNVDANFADPPELRNGEQVPDWGPAVLWEFEYEGDVYPNWSMIRGGTPKTASRKSLTECFYTSEFEIEEDELMEGMQGDYLEAPVAQNLDVPEDTQLVLISDNDQTNRLLGLGDTGAIVNAPDVTVRGFDFTLTASGVYGNRDPNTAYTDVALSIFEPFSLENFTIFSSDLGRSSKRSNVLALFNANQNLSNTGDVVYSVDDPVFFTVIAPGHLTARKFAFQLQTFDGGSISIKGNVFISLLVRFPKVVSF